METMTTLAVTLFAAFVIASALQLFFACVFARRLRNYRAPEVAEDRLPKVAVILCLRGVDPFLNECLERLARLDYPRFVLRVMVDSSGRRRTRLRRAVGGGTANCLSPSISFAIRLRVVLSIAARFIRRFADWMSRSRPLSSPTPIRCPIPAGYGPWQHR